MRKETLYLYDWLITIKKYKRCGTRGNTVTMEKDRKSKIISEFIWLFTLLLASAVAEYAIIVLFDLHPVLSVKIQGLIGLLVIAYGIRMVARLWDSSNKASQNDNDQNEMGIEADHQ